MSLKAEIVKTGKKGNKENLVITIPVKKVVSKSGKNVLIASTSGNAVTDLLVDGHPVTIGLNAYIPNTDAEESDDE